MPAPRCISPILDGFQLGDVITRKGPSQCCAATETLTGQQFVVKMISVPESAVLMDGLLMAGAFPDRAAANAYYKEQARGYLNQAKALRHLTALGGFADFDSVQVVPAERENGFEIYLLSPFRQSLQQMLQRKDLTQLEIVNMGLDICAALSACRHAGYYYADLKPSNVFYINGHYRIGDLGLVPLSSVGRTPLPENLRSRYTPPELQDGTRPLNDNADIYALGLMLYEAYNGGILPESDDLVGRLYAPPKYADYEMAEIILRACAPDPAIRWHDPIQMSNALARYLHRNGIRNTPIIPATLQELPVRPEPPKEEPMEPFLPEEPEEQPPAVQQNAPTPSAEKPKKKPLYRRPSVIVAAVLVLMLLIEITIGIWLMLRPDKIEIKQFSATVQEQSVVLTIDYEGDGPNSWVLTYQAEDGAEKTLYFVGSQVEVRNLQAGSAYCFTLSALDGQKVIGQTELRLTLPEQ